MQQMILNRKGVRAQAAQYKHYGSNRSRPLKRKLTPQQKIKIQLGMGAIDSLIKRGIRINMRKTWLMPNKVTTAVKKALGVTR